MSIATLPRPYRGLTLDHGEAVDIATDRARATGRRYYVRRKEFSFTSSVAPDGWAWVVAEVGEPL